MIHPGERNRLARVCVRVCVYARAYDDESETILTRRGKKRLKHSRL